MTIHILGQCTKPSTARSVGAWVVFKVGDLIARAVRCGRITILDLAVSITPDILERFFHAMIPKSAVIVPLYIYPVDNATWAPLYTAIKDNPDLEFLVIVNPDSGPGNAPSPSADYARELPRLNSYSNVSTIGYIRSDYCRRNIADILWEVDVYASWSKEGAASGIFVEGIFLDETPNQHSSAIDSYLKRIDVRVKRCTGISGKRLMVHNPGTMPDSILTCSRPDVTAIFEESYERYLLAEPRERLAMEQYERSKCCYIMHSVPAEEVKQVVLNLRRRAAYLFVTDLQHGVYNGFGPSWSIFIRAMQLI